MVEVPDSTTRYIQSDSGKPTKDLFNWMRNISQQLSDILSGTGGGMFSSGLPCFSVHKNSTNQSIPHNTTTAITWATEVYNVGGFFASNVWTPPVGKIALCTTTLLSVGAAGFQKQPVILLFMKNGSEIKRCSNFVASNAFGAISVINVGVIEDIANGTDAYGMSIVALSNDASNLTLSGTTSETYFMGHWISP